ncbi:hypothetical protein [Nonomuraea basaltis]|uniref:hypothetical protein n=1 Tax=Nonomuraea basaltis TaxID=2495887 RepID=UPI0014866D6D|nr:hypothetical protein [Nonomuraea basaltis]
MFEIRKERFEPPSHGCVSFDLASPAPFAGVLDQLLFHLQPGPQAWGVVGRGDELGAGQVEVAFARTFAGQTQAVTEFQFGLEEVALQPVDRLRWESTGLQFVGGGAGD